MKQDRGDISHYIHRTTPFKELMDHRRFKTDDIRFQTLDGSKRGSISGFVPLASCVWLRRIAWRNDVPESSPTPDVLCPSRSTSSHRIAHYT
ncbi:hypothetical protein PO909_011406 [Leuciscus waleckii]